MLTDRQRQTFDFIRAYRQRHGVAPKLREIAQHLGIRSRGTAHRYVRALEAEGLIAVEADVARGIELVARPKGRRTTLPLLGRIAAGRPVGDVGGQDEIE